MDKTFLSMSQSDLSRYDIIKRLLRKEIDGTKAAQLIGLSVRQVRRLKGQVALYGPSALIHGNRGQTSNRCLPQPERMQIVELLQAHYYDFWPTHASEKLAEIHGFAHDPKTIRQIMIDEGLWKPRTGQKKKEHREWRQRKAHYGEMEQFDGSYHDWFEDRAPKCCLLLAVDDATNNLTHAQFAAHEGVFPVFTFWLEYLQIHGKPMSIYMDKFSTYSMNHKLAKENPDTLTQFQRACEELRIEPILAHSPEAKGRVETTFGTLQNRLVKEMRLKNISTIIEANQYLKNEFIPWYNAKYARCSRGRANLHIQSSQNEQKRWPSILARQTERTVQNDFTISFANHWYQLNQQQPVTVCKRDKVIIEERMDNTIKIRLRDKYLDYRPIPKGQKQVKKPIPWVIAANYIVKEPRSKLIKVGHF